MIRDVIIHMLSEQPLKADLFAVPTSADVGLVCTNLRTLSGSRPVFVDDSASIFFFPYSHIRFLEIHPGSEGLPELPSGASGVAAAKPAEPAPEPEPEELEIDEDFLRRVREA